MITIFPSPEKWDLFNSYLKSELNSEYLIRSYINPYLASYDLIIGLAQLYAHKRSIAWIKGLTPFFNSVYSYFIREGYQVQTFSIEEIQMAKANFGDFIEKLKKDTLFFFLVKDHPLTGELYDFGDFENRLHSKKIFTISASHSNANLISGDQKTKPLGSIAADINYLSQDLTIIRMGEKFKVNSLLGAFQNMAVKQGKPSEPCTFDVKSLIEKKQFKAEIQNFESDFKSENYIQSPNRVWDRIILNLTQVHADELCHRLRALGFKNCFSLSPCATGSIKMFNQWMTPELSKSLLQSLLYFEVHSPADIPRPEQITNLIQEVITDSQWEF